MYVKCKSPNQFPRSLNVRITINRYIYEFSFLSSFQNDYKCLKTQSLDTLSIIDVKSKMLIYSILILVTHGATSIRCQQNCDDFSLGNCTNEENLIWQNDQVE